MNTPSTETSKAADEAAWWLHRLEQENTPEVQAEFLAWIRKASVHLEEFLFAQAVWRELDGIAPELRSRYAGNAERNTVVALGSYARGGDAVVSDPFMNELAGTSRSFRGWKTAVAATLLAVTVMVGYRVLTPTSPSYATTTGEQRSIKLPDGSILELNSRSRAQVYYTNEGREVRLQEGEAFFVVERDATRPFVVITDSARIRALGTQFNVSRRAGGETRVAVVDGSVQVTASAKRPSSGIATPISSDSRLDTGDEVEVARARIYRKPIPDVRQAIAWRTRELVFSRRRVAEIIEEFNRYNRVQLRAEGQALLERRMSGVFAADDPMPFVRFLEKEPGINVARKGDELVIRGE